MRARLPASLVVVLLASAVLLADDQGVLFDRDVNFASFKSFSMIEGTFTAKRPELNTPIAARALADAIGVALAGAGLQEVAANRHLLVEHSVKPNDLETTAGALVANLPAHAARLLTAYPPKKK
jgi:hypothetical protein